VEDKYSKPYQHLEGTEIQSAAYLGMIANIDENFGKLEAYLKVSGLEENTILIFLTDNGTQFGYSAEDKLGFNKGYRGNKSDKEEGGHRVPFFIRWPNGRVEGKRDISQLTAHVDLIPTLAGLCDLSRPEDSYLDGIDYAELLLGKETYSKERTVFVHHRQDWRTPSDVDGTCILKDEWRLINGNELYNIQNDPMQRTNLVDKKQELVDALLKENQDFLNKTKQLDEYKNLPVFTVGTVHQKEIKLTIQHAIGEDGGIWKSEHVAEGMKNRNNKYSFEIASGGKYKISFRRWPIECPGPILGVPARNPKNQFNYKTISPDKAQISIFDLQSEKDVLEGLKAVEFILDLPAGRTMLQTDFIEEGRSYGVYYTYIEKVDGD
jgi:hypothetical protein